jgi:very-short-patch-repair endonuclease
MKLAIEVDGTQHFRYHGKAGDHERDAWLKAHGIRVLRLPNRQVLENVEGVCEAIIAAASPQ